MIVLGKNLLQMLDGREVCGVVDALGSLHTIQCIGRGAAAVLPLVHTQHRLQLFESDGGHATHMPMTLVLVHALPDCGYGPRGPHLEWVSPYRISSAPHGPQPDRGRQRAAMPRLLRAVAEATAALARSLTHGPAGAFNGFRARMPRSLAIAAAECVDLWLAAALAAAAEKETAPQPALLGAARHVTRALRATKWPQASEAVLDAACERWAESQARSHAARRIFHAIKRAATNPYHALGRRRLLREFAELQACLTT